MRIGIIDLGTNSVRFDVNWIGPKNQVKLLHREKLMIRLGQGVFSNKKLDPHAIRRTVHAFTSFHRISSRFRVDKIIAFGTSALREAGDANYLLDIIKRKTCIDIRVISGEEEAELIGLGILSHETGLKGKFGLIDIGGGSTEISLCRGNQVLHASSFPLGTARLQQMFLRGVPHQAIPEFRIDPILGLRRYVRSTILSKTSSEGWPKVNQLLGSSGTIRALERILKKSMGVEGITAKALKKLVQSMSTMNQSELLSIPGMEAKRVDMIFAGALLLEECMNTLGAAQVNTTPYSLRDGILAREILHHSNQPSSNQLRPMVGFRLEDLYTKACRLGVEKPYLKSIVHLTNSLFSSTQRLHQLRNHWKPYLFAAAALRNTGEVITPIHHEAHSYYIVKNSDFLAMESWETEFIAQLCLKHTATKLAKKDLNFIKDKSKRQPFARLLALLTLIDAVDPGHPAKIKIQSSRLTATKLTLVLTGKDMTDLETLRIEQRKGLFEQVFKRHLVVPSRYNNKSNRMIKRK